MTKSLMILSTHLLVVNHLDMLQEKVMESYFPECMPKRRDAHGNDIEPNFAQLRKWAESEQVFLGGVIPLDFFVVTLIMSALS